MAILRNVDLIVVTQARGGQTGAWPKLLARQSPFSLLVQDQYIQ